MPTSVGQYLSKRLETIGIKHYFAIPGDFNLVLLDELIKNKNLQMINCCNELNAGYAADGYARAHGVSCAVVTFSVGMSIINAIAGAYGEDLPIILVSGGPNTDSECQNQILHHSLGSVDYSYQKEMFSKVTAYSVAIKHLSDAPHEIDKAIDIALKTKKPVYIEIPCNIAALKISDPHPINFSHSFSHDENAMLLAVEKTAEILNSTDKVALIGGAKLRAYDAIDSFYKLAEKSGYPVAMMPPAKGFFPENHPSYIGTYWGPASSEGCAEIIEAADMYLFAGALFSDYTTTGYSALINTKKLIDAAPYQIRLPEDVYNKVSLPKFLSALAKKTKKNDKLLTAYERIRENKRPFQAPDSATLLSRRQLFYHLQKMLTPASAVIAETGDSWFNCIQLHLPDGAGFEIQMQYGSIGWSVGATLGYALATQGKKRVITVVGDGSFQMTAQEVSTMIRYGLDPIIILVNNGGYTIEVEIHDGPYNVIKNWKYAELINVLNAEDGKGLGIKVSNEKQLQEALEKAKTHKGLVLIEAILDKDDCNERLLTWGSHVALNNGRPPQALKSQRYGRY